jgi:outer membrane protein OmpA-like peptidoglycan-associated protein
MKNQIWLYLTLAAALTVPAVAQQDNSSSTTQNPPAAATQNTDQQNAQAAQQTTTEQTQAHQPLTAERHEGFWGKINPFARKKYVQRQMEPIRGRVNELDELSAANANAIKDTDSRAQEGIRMANGKATEADQHAVDASNRAQQANQLASHTGTRLNTVESVVGNIDQYQSVTEADIHFRAGQTTLSKNAKDALDQMADTVKNQKGYIVQVQGYSSGKGQAAIENSRNMAQSVVRYLVINHQIPVYRIYLLGMGNAPAPAPAEATTAAAKRRATTGGRVEVSLLKNSLEQISSSEAAAPGTQGGMSGTTAQPSQQAQPSPSNPQQPMEHEAPPAPQQ